VLQANACIVGVCLSKMILSLKVELNLWYVCAGYGYNY